MIDRCHWWESMQENLNAFLVYFCQIPFFKCSFWKTVLPFDTSKWCVFNFTETVLFPYGENIFKAKQQHFWHESYWLLLFCLVGPYSSKSRKFCWQCLDDKTWKRVSSLWTIHRLAHKSAWMTMTVIHEWKNEREPLSKMGIKKSDQSWRWNKKNKEQATSYPRKSRNTRHHGSARAVTWCFFLPNRFYSRQRTSENREWSLIFALKEE